VARILVQVDDQQTVLMDERDVRPEHLEDPCSADQLVQRVGWAVRDAGRPTSHRPRSGPIAPPRWVLTTTLD
jgi:hypothetical protein